MFNGHISGVTVPSLLKDLCFRKSSCSVICKMEGITKSITVWKGNVTSASSTLIDDRLGEVIYRDGRLSLDTFVDAAGKVTKQMRFGDLLLKSGLFTPFDLWDALTNQTQAILSSLCFYEEVEVEMDYNVQAPKFELPVQFHLAEIFKDAHEELHFVRSFEKAARTHPKLEIVESSIGAADNDFLRDMVALIKDSKDYFEIVDKASRLSKIYTNRTLFELLIRGVIKDTWGLTNSRVSPQTTQSLASIIEDGQFMFTELANAAKNEQITEWEQIVQGAHSMLTRHLGKGLFLTLESGLIQTNIIHAAIFRSKARSQAAASFHRMWPDNLAFQLRETILSAILFILFELCNRKFASPEFARVKGVIDGLRLEQT